MKFKSDVDVEAALAVSGDVGVGTTAPLRKLHVVGGSGFAVNASASQYYGVYIPALGEGADPRIDIGDWHNAGSTIKWDSSARSLNLDTQYSTGAGTFNITGNDGASTFLTVLPSGNVGIGTTSPSAKLEVNGDIQLTAKADAILFGSSGSDGAWGAPKIARIGSSLIMSDYSGVQFGGYDGSAYGPRMTVKGTGNVGIGTTSPYGRLNVIPSSNPTTPTAANQISIGESSANSQYNLRLGYFLEGGAYKGSIQAISGNTPNTLILNGDGGNVGIGTTSPTHKLHVNGDMRLTGALRDSNNATGSAGQVLSSTGSATDWIPLPATPTIYTPKVYNLNNSTNINSQGQKLVPDFGTLEIEGNTTIQQVSGSDTDFQVTGENTGIYEVTYAVFYKNTGNQRTPLGTYLTLNGTAVNGSLMVNYLRSDVAGGGNWSSCTNTFYVNVTDASHPIALCVRRADSSTAPSGISMVEPAGMAVKSTISFRRIS